MHLAETGRGAAAAEAGGTRLLHAALILSFAVPGLAVAAEAEAPEPTGLVLVLDAADTPEKKTRRRAARSLTTAGADAGDPADYLLVSSLVGPDSLRRVAAPEGRLCKAGAPALSPEQLAAAVDGAESNAQFGKSEEARAALEGTVTALPCLSGVPTPRDLHRMWFLLGALAHQESRPDEARRALARAVQIAGDYPFDKSWPPALQTLMAEAREEVVERPATRLVVLAEGAKVHLDGTLLAADGLRVDVPMKAGVHLVQIERTGAPVTTVLDLEGRPISVGLPAFAAYDAAGLRAGIDGLIAGADSPLARAASGVLQTESAARGLAWMLVVPAEGPVLRVDPIARRVTRFEARLARGDAFSRRLRLMVAGELRAQAAASTTVNYGAFTIGLWASIAPPLKLGTSLTLNATAAEPPPGKSACCVLPELSFRTRIEWPPEGLFRPLAELGVGIVWPDGVGSSTVAAIEGLGGFLLVPGVDRRVGISVAVGAGGLAEIGGYFRVRAGAELRF